MTTQVFVNNSTRSDAAWAQAADDLVYKTFQSVDATPVTAAAARAAIAAAALLTSVAGTNTVTATTGPVQTAYVLGQVFVLIPAVTNTAATTLNVSGLGAKNVFINGAACFGGELIAGVPVLVVYDGTQFAVIGWKQPALTSSLSADVALNNTASFFTGPTVAQGTVGTWLVSGNVSILDTTGASTFNVRLWDGTNVIAECQVNSTGAGASTGCHLSGRIASPVGNLKISVQDISFTTGKITFNACGNSKDSTLTATRIG